jgi:hypothetical protein
MFFSIMISQILMLPLKLFIPNKSQQFRINISPVNRIIQDVLKTDAGFLQLNILFFYYTFYCGVAVIIQLN